MCIAIAKPAGKDITDAILKECYLSNPHGCGFSYPDEQHVNTVKGVMPFEKFIELYRKFVPINKAAIIHFRWSTAGAQNVDNCHPFATPNDKYAVIHNGTLPAPYGRSRSGKSDTRDFVDHTLSPLLNDLGKDSKFNSPHFTELLSLAIGNGNKIVVINKDGEFLIANQHLGHYVDGVWYSNHDYIPKKETVKKVKKTS